MVLGAVWCPLAKTKDISHKLKEIKKILIIITRKQHSGILFKKVKKKMNELLI